MKQYIVGIVFGLVALSMAVLNDEQRKMMEDLQNQCVSEVGTAAPYLDKMSKGEYPDDPEIEKFVLCMSKKTGFMDDAGEIQDEDMRLVISMIIDEDETNKLVDKCAKKQDTAGKTARLMAECFYNSGFH